MKYYTKKAPMSYVVPERIILRGTALNRNICVLQEKLQRQTGMKLSRPNAVRWLVNNYLKGTIHD